MLNKTKGRPLWYKIWTLSVGIAAVYVLIAVFTKDGLGKGDLILMVYTHVSLLADLYFFPDRGEAAAGQKSD